MQRAIIAFEYVINGKTISVQCEPNFPIADAKEGAYQFLKDIGKIEEPQAEAQKKAEEEAKQKQAEEQLKEESA